MTFSEGKKRVLMVGPLPPTVGGITAFISGVRDSNLNKKYNLLTFGTERPTVGVVRDVSDYTAMLRIGLIRSAKSIVWTLSHLLTFPFILFRNRPHIVHVHTASYWPFWENAVYVLVSQMLSKRTFFHIHGGGFDDFYRNSNRLMKFAIRKVLDLPDKVIVLSSTWKRFLASFASEEKIEVLQNFVDFSQYSRFKREVSPSKDVITVLFVGGVGAREKGLYDVFKSIPIVMRQCENILFLFVACSNISNLDAICRKEEIASRTRILGYLHGNKKTRIFVESSIFVLPSYSEGLPITMLEAMAAGLPVITTSVGAIPEIIEDGKNGFLIDPGDYYTLAEEIIRLARDKKLRARMGKNNMNKVRERYTLGIVVRKLDNLYGQLIDGYKIEEKKVIQLE